MGPIEKELRAAPHGYASTFEHWYWHERHTLACCQVIGGAIASLGIVGHGVWTFRLFYLDILSEAIEAAETLGL